MSKIRGTTTRSYVKGCDKADKCFHHVVIRQKMRQSRREDQCKVDKNPSDREPSSSKSSPQIAASDTTKTLPHMHKRWKKIHTQGRRNNHSTSIAMMKSYAKTAYDTYSKAKHKRSRQNVYKVHGFEHISHKENRRNRGSIW
eukprot:1098862_1